MQSEIKEHFLLVNANLAALLTKVPFQRQLTSLMVKPVFSFCSLRGNVLLLYQSRVKICSISGYFCNYNITVMYENSYWLWRSIVGYIVAKHARVGNVVFKFVCVVFFLAGMVTQCLSVDFRECCFCPLAHGWIVLCWFDYLLFFFVFITLILKLWAQRRKCAHV